MSHQDAEKNKRLHETVIEIDEDGKVHGDISGLQPQAASGVALNAELFDGGGPLNKEDLLALDALEKTHPNLWRHFRECGQAVLELQKREIERKATSGGALSIDEVRDAHQTTLRESLDFQDSYFYRKLTERLNVQVRLNRVAENVEQKVHESYAADRLAANDQKVRSQGLTGEAQEDKKYGLGHEGDSIAAAIRRLKFPPAPA